MYQYIRIQYLYIQMAHWSVHSQSNVISRHLYQNSLELHFKNSLRVLSQFKLYVPMRKQVAYMPIWCLILIDTTEIFHTSLIIACHESASFLSKRKRESMRITRRITDDAPTYAYSLRNIESLGLQAYQSKKKIKIQRTMVCISIFLPIGVLKFGMHVVKTVYYEKQLEILHITPNFRYIYQVFEASGQCFILFRVKFLTLYVQYIVLCTY